MEDSKVLSQNMREVNELLKKVSGIGIFLLFSLCFILKYFGLMEIMTYTELTVSSVSSFAFYFITLFLYRIERLHKYFHYIFPLQMFCTIGVGFYLFNAIMPAFFIWLIPIIYSGLYAHKGAMLLIGGLVMVTAPLETYLVGQAPLSEIAVASVIMLIIILRLISMVNRSRVLIFNTEQEVDRSTQLQRENQQMLIEVAATTEEIGRVIEQLNQMTQGTREAMVQIAQGGEQIIVSSQESKHILVQTQEFIGKQVEKSAKIDESTKQAVNHAKEVEAEASAGEEVVSRIATIIETIDQQSHKATDKAMLLADRTQEIFAISESITNIAKNVTVVAINASIEAARAGAAGRTFQVVAEQVQKLAIEASEAAKAIGQLSEHVQDDLTEIKNSMVENRDIVQVGVNISQEAKIKLRHIEKSVEEIHHLLKDIAQDSQAQQQGALKIESGMNDLRKRTEENLVHIETAAASTQETAAIMDEFMMIVQRLQDRSEKLQRMLKDMEQ